MKILLFTDNKKVLEKTEKISKGWFELIWCKYNDLQKEQYPFANIVIIHFDRKNIIKGTFLPIIKIKSKMGEAIDEYYDLIEVYKGLDRYDQELVWLMIQNIRKNAEKRKRDRDDD